MTPVEYDARPAAVKPLMDTFWSPQGWRNPPVWPSAEVHARAIAAGVMFTGTRTLDHDAWVAAVRSAVAAVTIDQVSTAFLTSLTTRRLDLRSALGSFAIARHLPAHEFTRSRGTAPYCGICGAYPESGDDLNVLNFERFMWGGVRRDSIGYIAFDLEQFTRAPREQPSTETLETGQHLIAALRNAAPEATATKIAPQLRMITGNKAEREILLDILGVCGILQTAQHPGYRSRFVPSDQRQLPNRHDGDRTYPLCWWTGRDGVGDDALQEFLPQIL